MASLSKITKNGKAFFLAYDQGLEHGPSDFNQHNVDPAYILNLANHGKFTAVIVHKGIAEKYYHKYKYDVPLIIKLNGKTSLTTGAPFSPLICSVEEAIELGAVAVGYTVYVGSPREGEMFETFGNLIERAHKHSVPVIGWMYPRGEGIEPKDPQTIAYAARVGMELGADMVKINYPGSVEALQWAIQCAGKTHVVVSGGSKHSADEVIQNATDIMAAGASGLAIGRNIWQQEHPLEIASKLRSLLF